MIYFWYITIDSTRNQYSQRSDYLSQSIQNVCNQLIQRNQKKKKSKKKGRKKQTNLSKQRSTLSDMSNNIQSCSSAITCMSLSSPVPMVSHSKSVSGSMSAIICSRYFDVNIFLMWLYHWQNFYSLNCPMANNSVNCYKISNLFCISIFCSLKIKTISHEKNGKKNIISMYFH